MVSIPECRIMRRVLITTFLFFFLVSTGCSGISGIYKTVWSDTPEVVRRNIPEVVRAEKEKQKVSDVNSVDKYPEIQSDVPIEVRKSAPGYDATIEFSQ
jgi:hypothetical protein